jgi:MFS family permease
MGGGIETEADGQVAVAPADAPTGFRAAALSSFSNRNFKIYYLGQVVSTAGTLMQSVALSWLVLRLAGNGTALGVVISLQFLPLLVFGGPAGVLLDRVDRKQLYLTTQTLAASQAFLLGILTVTGSVRLWMVYVLAFFWGTVTAVDQPVRQTFLYDLVGPEQLHNAIALQVALSSTSWAAGPALAGLTIAVLGVGPCFIANGVSYVIGIATLAAVRRSELHPSPRQPRRKGQFRDALAYVRRTPAVRSMLAFTAMFFVFAWEFEVVMPLLAKNTFHGGGGLFGAMMATIGSGSAVASIAAAGIGRPSPRRLVISALCLAATFLMAAAVPALWMEFVVLGVLGGLSAVVTSTCNAMTQLSAEPGMRGRVVSLWLVAALGTKPAGGPIVGYVGQHFGARAGLVLGAAGTLVGLGLWHVLRRSAAAAPSPVEVEATAGISVG